MAYKPVVKNGSARTDSITDNETVKIGLLKVRTANQAIKDARLKETPMQLCGNLWFENEVCILFADTNLGKSVLAVQIADAISRGEGIGNLKCTAKAQPVLYLDFEQSDKQFQNRYSVDYDKEHLWHSNFLKVNLDTSFIEYQDFEEQIFLEIEMIIKDENAKVLIVDNITYLKMQSTEKGNEAMLLMKRLIRMKHEFDLSLLILAHTPKRAHLHMPLTLNDLAGSKQLANFADSCFGINSSTQGHDLRYIKQMKARSCTVQEEVLVYRLEKNHNFLGFTFIECDFESNHLTQKENKQSLPTEVRDLILKTKEDNPNWGLRKIAELCNVSHTSVSRVLKESRSEHV